jgi:hypothetical protein
VNTTVCSPVSRLRSRASENVSETTGRSGCGGTLSGGQEPVVAVAVGVAVGDAAGEGDAVRDGVGVGVGVGVGEGVAVAVGLGVGEPVAVAGVGAARSRSSRSVHAGAVMSIAVSSHAEGRRMLTP